MVSRLEFIIIKEFITFAFTFAENRTIIIPVYVVSVGKDSNTGMRNGLHGIEAYTLSPYFFYIIYVLAKGS